MKLLLILILIGGLFGPLGAVMAALITYNEYVRHYPDKREPLRMAVKMGIFTLAFFIILCAVLAFVFSKINI